MTEPLRVACIGMGWWSDVLADAIKRSDRLKIVACYTRSEDKRAAFARKYGCHAAVSYDEVLADPQIEAVINTTPNDVHLETTRQAAEAASTSFSTSRSPILSRRGARSPKSVPRRAWCSGWATSAAARATSAG